MAYLRTTIIKWRIDVYFRVATEVQDPVVCVWRQAIHLALALIPHKLCMPLRVCVCSVLRVARHLIVAVLPQKFTKWPVEICNLNETSRVARHQQTNKQTKKHTVEEWQ